MIIELSLSEAARLHHQHQISKNKGRDQIRQSPEKIKEVLNEYDASNGNMNHVMRKCHVGYTTIRKILKQRNNEQR
jgi:hypothetical protein